MNFTGHLLGFFFNQVITFSLWLLHPLACRAFSSILLDLYHGSQGIVLQDCCGSHKRWKFELLGQPFTTSHPLRGSHCTWITISSHLFLLNNGTKKPQIHSQMNAQRPFITWSKYLVTNHTRGYQFRLQVCNKRPKPDQNNSIKCWEGGKLIEAFLKQKIRF